MKVCIITLQYTNNYGAVLQCYALQKALEELGHTVGILNFPALITRRQPWWQGWGFKSGVTLASLRSKYIRLRYSNSVWTKFENFRKDFLKLTRKIESVGDVGSILGEYDAAVVGSDQVWNQKWYHPLYYLGSTSLGSIPLNLKKVSFAASAGSGAIPSDRKEKIRRWLEQFYALSVRDDLTQSLLRESLGIESSVACDPTLLVDISDIESGQISLPEGGYVLGYFLHERSRALAQKTLEHSAKRLGLPVLSITVSAHETMRLDGADRHLNDVGPAEWHSLFRHANFICTDSFHGSMFSAKFRKPFVYCISDPTMGTRLDDAAKRYAFEEVRVTSSKEIEKAFGKAYERDQDNSLNLIRLHATLSKNFLIETLNSDPQ